MHFRHCLRSPPASIRQGAVEARNANYATICRQLTFISRAWFEEEAPAPVPGPRGKLGLPAPVAAPDTPGEEWALPVGCGVL